MWIFPILFIVGVSSGRGADLARRPMTLTANLLTLAVTVILLVTVPGSQGCAGGTCIADGYFFVLMLALSIGVLGYLVGGILCSLEESGTANEAQIRIAVRCIYAIAIIGAVGAILYNMRSVGAALSR